MPLENGMQRPAPHGSVNAIAPAISETLAGNDDMGG